MFYRGRCRQAINRLEKWSWLSPKQCCFDASLGEEKLEHIFSHFGPTSLVTVPHRRKLQAAVSRPLTPNSSYYYVMEHPRPVCLGATRRTKVAGCRGVEMFAQLPKGPILEAVS